MTISAHQLPRPHDAVEGSLDDDLADVEGDLKPNYEAEETNTKVPYKGAHASDLNEKSEGEDD